MTTKSLANATKENAPAAADEPADADELKKQEKYVLIVGNLTDGFEFYGPFDSEIDAESFGEAADVQIQDVVPLVDPMEESSIDENAGKMAFCQKCADIVELDEFACCPICGNDRCVIAGKLQIVKETGGEG